MCSHFSPLFHYFYKGSSVTIELLRWCSGKELPANARAATDLGLIPGWGRSSGGGKWKSNPVFFPGKSHGQKILVGFSPWGHKELDTHTRGN